MRGVPAYRAILGAALACFFLALTSCTKEDLVEPCDGHQPNVEFRSNMGGDGNTTDVRDPRGEPSSSNYRNPEPEGGGGGISDDGDDEADNERNKKKGK